MPPTKVSHTTAEAASRVVAGPRRQVGVTTRGWWAERAGRQQAFPALAKAAVNINDSPIRPRTLLRYHSG